MAIVRERMMSREPDWASQVFNLYAEYIMQNTRLDEAQAGIKIAWRNINILRYADDTTLMAESREELKSCLGFPYFLQFQSEFGNKEFMV